MVRTLRYVFAVLLVGTLFLICCTRAEARDPLFRPPPAPPPYSFSIEDEQGQGLPTFRHEGRTYLLGEPGLRYNIRVRNPTGQRVEAVVTVDGRDVVSGREGDYVNERGYLIPPYGSALIEGFRQSFEEVAAFRFTSPEDSYSARKGTPQNVGVIGVAFFPERPRPPAPIVRRPVPVYRRPLPAPYPMDYGSTSGPRGGADRTTENAPERRKSAAAPSTPQSPSAAPGVQQSPRATHGGAADARSADRYEEGSAGSVDNLGTQYGETHQSSVSEVSFQRASPTHPAFVLSLRYDDVDGLSARGIDVSAFQWRASAPRYPEPEAFPQSRFAQPPP